MQLPQPYIYTSERMNALVDRSHMHSLPSEGLMTDTVFGYHSLWAAEVPFIPAGIDRETRDFSATAVKRISQTLQRQMRFLSELARMHEHSTTFEFRLISWPQPNRLTRVSIAFLGKTFHPEQAVSRQLALKLWDAFCALFPSEAPFFYPLVPVEYLDRAVTVDTHSFQECFEPFPWQNLTQTQSIVELRKYEDWPTVRNIGGTLHIGDYIPHPFRPADDFSPLTNLLITMARQQQICLVAITLRPQRLTEWEIVILHELADWYRSRAAGEVPPHNPASAVLNKFKNEVFEAYMRQRATLGQQVYENLTREHHNLFLTRIQVVGQPLVQDEVVEALGSTMITNVGEAHPSSWVKVQPQPDEVRRARFNLQWLEFARWGLSPLVRQDRRVLRFRQLATAHEVSGTFCLPLAPAEGQLAGIEVRNEPFPARALPGPSNGITLGTVLDRGVPTSIPCILPREALTDTVVFLGVQGSSRTRFIEHLLNGTRTMGWPWIHITAGMRREPASQAKLWPQHILIDGSIPDSERATPGCHLLVPPPGCSLLRFQDALLHVLGSIFSLPQSTSIVLRSALRETYRLSGWTDEQAGNAPTPALLAEQIEMQMRKQTFPQEFNTLLMNHCVLPLRDLADTAAWLFQCETQRWVPTEALWIEVGWVGSNLNNQFIRGCLWAWFMLALSSLAKEPAFPHTLLSLDEAHLFFPEVASAHAFSLASLLDYSTTQGRGALLFSDRSNLLAREIYERTTLTLLTQQDRAGVSEYLPDLTPRQRQRLAHLQAGEIALIARHSEVFLALLS